MALLLTVFLSKVSLAEKPGYFHFLPDWNQVENYPALRNSGPIEDSDRICLSQGHFFTLGEDLTCDAKSDVRIKFWGVNLSPPLTFPRNKNEADRLASKIEKLGFNLVRIHGMDVNSDRPEKTLLEQKNTTSFPSFYDRNLDALQLQLEAFREHGIYVAITLRANYEFESIRDCATLGNNSILCVPDPAVGTVDGNYPSTMPRASRPLDLFNREMIILQKRFFRKLLDPIKANPALALIEINNENSLIEQALRGNESLPYKYARELDQLWNRWLYIKYGNLESIRNTWHEAANESIPAPVVKNGDFSKISPSADAPSWGTVNVGNSNWLSTRTDIQEFYEIVINEVPKKYWHAYVEQTGLKIDSDVPYCLDFRARSSEALLLGVSLQAMGDHSADHIYSGPKRFSLNEEWSRYRFCFVASRGDLNARLAFLPTISNVSDALVQLDDVSLSQAAFFDLTAGRELRESEDAITGNIPRPPSINSSQAVSKAVYIDYLDFLADTEADYYRDMYSFLKDEVKTKALITGTQADYGGLLSHRNMSEEMDYLDYHYYWDHPKIPRDDQARWTMTNKSMLSSVDGSFVTSLAGVRAQDKPLVVSEYSPNHANEHSHEGYLFAAIYGARKDVDGIVVFTYFASGGDIRNSPDPKRLLHWYNLAGDTRAETMMHAASRIFRSAVVTNDLCYVDILVNDLLRHGPIMDHYGFRSTVDVFHDEKYLIGKGGNPFTTEHLLDCIVRVNHISGRERASFSVSGFRHKSGIDKDKWLLDEGSSAGGYLQLDSPAIKVVSGNLNREISLSGLEIEPLGSSDNFASVAVLSAKEEPIEQSRVIFITKTGKGRNSRTRVYDKDGGKRLCTSVVARPCEKPFWDPQAGIFVMRDTPLKVRLASVHHFKAVKIEAIGENGHAIGNVDYKVDHGQIEFTLTGFESPWYRLSFSD